MTGETSGKCRKRWLIAVAVLVLVIILFSQQSGEESTRLSNMLADFLGLEGQGIFDASSRPLFLGLSLRKFAHIFLFALLGFSSMGYFKSFWKAVTFCLACAVLDEGHQLLVTGRTGQALDVLIDAVGNGVGIGVWKMWKRIRFDASC